MSDGLSQQATQPPLAGGGGGGGAGQVPAVILAGSVNEQLKLTTAVLGPQSTGSVDERMAQTGTVTVPVGSRNAALTIGPLVGSGSRSLGSRDTALTPSVTGTIPASLGARNTSASFASTILGRGFVQTAATAGGVLWTNPANVEADDSAVASWVTTEGLGAGAGATSTGTLTATNPRLGSTPAGWTRTKVEVLVHRNDTAVGLNATGDTATFTVALQDKTGAALQTVVNDSFTAAGSNADSTVATDVTAAVAAISDADLALTKYLLTATFARTLVAAGTRSWTVNVDSISMRITYTRSGLT
jgi:hypothetical protein